MIVRGFGWCPMPDGMFRLPIFSDEEIGALSRDELRDYLDMAAAEERRVKRRKLWSYYPDEGPLRRELYQKHLNFFRLGRDHKERLMLAANRVGKTEGVGGFETALHLTGHYPPWWEGARFDRPIRAWAAGKSNETTRDIIMKKMFGEVAHEGVRKRVTGEGLVPFSDIGEIHWKRGTDLIDWVKVQHHDNRGRPDGWSILGLKSYEQGRGSFEGTEQEVIWLDEEPKLEVYTECLVRTMTTQGLILLTFTPLEGMSEVVLQFLPGGELPGSSGDDADGVEDQWPGSGAT